MTTSRYRLFLIPLVLIFLLLIPLIQSFIFSSNTKGTIEVNKVVKSDFIKSDKKIILLFFGYVGCTDVCTPILNKLNNLYKSKKFQDIKEDVEILFVNLTPEVQQFQPNLFAKYFNKDFKGIYLSKKETLNIDRNFGVFFSRDLSEETELNHTDYIYLIDNYSNSKILKNIYTTHPLNKIKLINDIMLLKRRREL